METDYKNLNLFDGCAVVFIALGVVLIGAMAFINLTPTQQKHLAVSMQMFDIHEQASREMEAIKFITGIPSEFFNEFYIAFSETVKLPDDHTEMILVAAAQVEILTADFLNYSDQVVAGYFEMNQPARIEFRPRVAGAVILQRGYDPPEVDWRNVYERIINLK